MPRRFECGRLLPCAVLLVATVARCGGGSAPVYSPPDTPAPAADVPDAIPDAQDVDPGASTPADAGPTDLRRSFDRGGTPVVRDTETPTDVDEPAKDAPDVSPARDDATEDPDPGAADVEATIDEGPCADTCASLSCGDDGCGGSCGTCGDEEVCHLGLCLPERSCGNGVCEIEARETCQSCPGDCACADGSFCSVDGTCCTPDCALRQCGSDGCGGSCGTCAEGSVCLLASGACCLPECEGKLCGDDGCGETCGTCPEGNACEAGACIAEVVCGDGACEGTRGETCSTCVEDCGCGTDQVCTADGLCCVPQCLGRVCGADGCGTSCGDCSEGAICTEVGRCCSPVCEDRQCGPDGCGGECGACVGMTVCTDAGRCCVPVCGDAQCGEDGCGGQCGSCAEGAVCDGGVCVEESSCGDGSCHTASGESCLTCEQDCPCLGGGLCIGEGRCCISQCSERVCGDDLCGGSCGQCAPGDICEVGACVQPDPCGDGECNAGGDEDCRTCALDCRCEAGLVCLEAGSCCLRQCTDKACGPDRCGGHCGLCTTAQVCTLDGACTEAGVGLPRVEINPPAPTSGDAVGVKIFADTEHLLAALRVIGPCGLVQARWLSEEQVDASIWRWEYLLGRVTGGIYVITFTRDGGASTVTGASLFVPGEQDCADAGTGRFPKMEFDPADPVAGSTVVVSALDLAPWNDVGLRIGGPCGVVQPAFLGVDRPEDGVWRWRYQVGPLTGGGYGLHFSRDGGEDDVISRNLAVRGVTDCRDQGPPPASDPVVSWTPEELVVGDSALIRLTDRTEWSNVALSIEGPCGTASPSVINVETPSPGVWRWSWSSDPTTGGDYVLVITKGPESSELVRATISVPGESVCSGCGDGRCIDGESCVDCPVDCGPCHQDD